MANGYLNNIRLPPLLTTTMGLHLTRQGNVKIYIFFLYVLCVIYDLAYLLNGFVQTNACTRKNAKDLNI